MNHVVDPWHHFPVKLMTGDKKTQAVMITFCVSYD